MLNDPRPPRKERAAARGGVARDGEGGVPWHASRGRAGR